MTTVLEVKNLEKVYEKFTLGKLSFSLEKGKITGFIGRNGAGKTTTIKSLINLISSSGEINFFGLDLKTHEAEIKKRIGYAVGGTAFYTHKKLNDVILATKPFYDNWDDETCEKYLKIFKLDKTKKIKELSEGMKVKFRLALALSHSAELLILDEPTSGLDPVSREELNEVFINLAKSGKTILFSTHITEDLDACADKILYIKKGKIIADCDYKDFIDNFVLVKLSADDDKSKFLGVCTTKDGFTGLIEKKDAELFAGYETEKPDVGKIMTHLEKDNAENGLN